MAFVTSASTLAEVKAAYEDNVQYDVGGGVTMAQEFLVAARIYLRRMAQQTSKAGTLLQDEYRKIEAEITKAEQWLGANNPSATTAVAPGGVRHLSVENFRI